MRFSTCRTEISLSISDRHFSRRLATLSVSSTSCFSAILTERCEATVSASFEIVVDLRHRADDLGRDPLVELHIAFEFGDRPSGRAPRPRPASRASSASDFGVRFVIIVGARVVAHAGARRRLRPAPSPCRRAASAAAAPRRACRSDRSRRSPDRRRRRSSASRAG